MILYCPIHDTCLVPDHCNCIQINCQFCYGNLGGNCVFGGSGIRIPFWSPSLSRYAWWYLPLKLQVTFMRHLPIVTCWFHSRIPLSDHVCLIKPRISRSRRENSHSAGKAFNMWFVFPVSFKSSICSKWFISFPSRSMCPAFISLRIMLKGVNVIMNWRDKNEYTTLDVNTPKVLITTQVRLPGLQGLMQRKNTLSPMLNSCKYFEIQLCGTKS